MDHDDPMFAPIRDAVLTSVEELYDRDAVILGTTERVVVGRLMIYLNARLTQLISRGYVLDQEYERFGLVKKAFTGGAALEDRKFVPDIILHRRLDNADSANLLAVEVKTDRQRGRLHDFAKLSLLTGHAHYALAFNKSLRLEGAATPAGQRQVGEVYRPDCMSPYRFGLWLLVLPQRAEFWWWLNGAAPQLLDMRTPSRP
ncbi:hypothetical protein Dvina_37415 [Dactylosporangium vinaceum]|uniref:Uncharacterized protein n=1 Tax=Dactylosporangium vinaceum TaxID=53362 RepID=A0ABV5MQY4_9ACTN|nr:hypothetical protein [Dactylosporangium vinaceum]UAB93843.1 hypothetical protein Dvina_37415 [Dactylosporangium vinaceum]